MFRMLYCNLYVRYSFHHNLGQHENLAKWHCDSKYKLSSRRPSLIFVFDPHLAQPHQQCFLWPSWWGVPIFKSLSSRGRSCFLCNCTFSAFVSPWIRLVSERKDAACIYWMLAGGTEKRPQFSSSAQDLHLSCRVGADCPSWVEIHWLIT